MERRPIIIVNTDNYPTFCDNRCNNTNCKKHMENMRFHTGGCKISKLRDTEECEGYISKWKQSHREIEQIKREMRERTKIIFFIVSFIFNSCNINPIMEIMLA